MSVNREKLIAGLERSTQFRFVGTDGDGVATRNYLEKSGKLSRLLKSKETEPSQVVEAINELEGAFLVMATAVSSGLGKSFTTISEQEQNEMIEMLDSVRKELRAEGEEQ